MASILAVGGIVIVAVVLQVLWRRSQLKREAEVEALARDLSALGELSPDTLHPQVDVDRCIGSGACVRACPEHDVIALREKRAYLVNPLACIGHSACSDACPVSAITLVFGTAKRGVELPRVDRTFETNQPGVYIVGELGGMGLIRNAVKQGKEAAEAIAGRGRRGAGAVKDAIVVGAGPAGIAATLGLMKAGLSVDLLDGSEYGGTIKHYPRGKIVMNGRLDLPLYGTVRRKVHKKEDLLAVWDDVRAQTGLAVETGITVEGLTRTQDGNWTLQTTRGDRQAVHVVLALGRRGSPRKLGVPGEDLDKVAYRLLEPEVFAGKHVLVVGGGNSAVESALALADFGGCASVTLSYRRAELARVRRQNRARIDEVIRAGKVRGMMPSEVVSVTAREVCLKAKGVTTTIPNDAIIVQIGGTAPTELLSTFGIALQTKFGEA